MKCYRPYVSKTYEFETTDVLQYYRFIQVLKMLDIGTLDVYEGSRFYDYHNVRFYCDKNRRLRAEYIFRRFMGLEVVYLLDLDTYQNRAERYREENYAIY